MSRMCKSTCIHNFSSASPVDSPFVHDISSASPVDSPCVHDISSASPVDLPCLHNVSSPSPVDLPVAVAYAPRYYRRCGIGISIFYFSICTLCCVNVLHICSDRILTFRIKSICSPAKVGLVVTDLITSPVVSWEGVGDTPPSTEAQLSFFAQPPAWEDLSAPVVTCCCRLLRLCLRLVDVTGYFFFNLDEYFLYFFFL